MKKFILLFCFFLIPKLLASNLLQIYQLAKDNDPTYKIAVSRFHSALENLPISTSALFPQIAITANASRGNSLSDDNEISSTNTRSYNYGLSLTQPLININQWLSIRSAKISQKSAMATFIDAKQNLISRVIISYMSVLNAKQNLDISHFLQKISAKDLHQTKLFFQAGLKQRTDLMNALANYELAQHAVNVAKQNYYNELTKLTALTHVVIPKLAELKNTFPLVKPKPLNINSWLSFVKQNNPKIIADRYDVLASKTNISIQASLRLPSMNANASLGHNFNRNDTFGATRSKGASASVSLNFPILQGGSVFYKTKKSRFDYQTSIATLQQDLENQLALTKQHYYSLLNDMQNIKLDYQAIIANRNALNSTNELYRAGQADFLDVIAAQNHLITAKKNLVDDENLYINDFVNLKLAAGLLSEKDLILINNLLK